ncbi:MAG: hypothetical protein EBU49_02200 [Proteobacteria bacterium]|nr:hypothetical protein [Pseudomonadota bacterium]
MASQGKCNSTGSVAMRRRGSQGYRKNAARIATSTFFFAVVTTLSGNEAFAAPVPKDPDIQEYRDSVSSKYDPDAVSHEGDSGMTLSFGLGLGQARPTQSGGAGGIAFQAGIEPGYTSQTGRFSRIEASAEFFFGRAGYTLSPDDGDEKVSLPIKFGMLAKFGLGSAAGNGAYSTWKFGLGPVFASYSGEQNNGDTISSTGSLVGLAGMVGYTWTFDFTKHFAFNVGAELRHIEFDVSPAEKTEAGAKTTVKVNRVASINIPQLIIGPRIKF